MAPVPGTAPGKRHRLCLPSASPGGKRGVAAPGPPPALARSLRHEGAALARRTRLPPPGPGSAEPHAALTAGSGRDAQNRATVTLPPPAPTVRSHGSLPSNGFLPRCGGAGGQLRRGRGPRGGALPVPAAMGGGASGWHRAARPGGLPCHQVAAAPAVPVPPAESAGHITRPIYRRREPRPDSLEQADERRTGLTAFAWPRNAKENRDAERGSKRPQGRGQATYLAEHPAELNRQPELGLRILLGAGGMPALVVRHGDDSRSHRRPGKSRGSSHPQQSQPPPAEGRERRALPERHRWCPRVSPAPPASAD